MKFVETPLEGVLVVKIDALEDERGMFARTFCAETFRARGLHAVYPQCNVSTNRRRGTVRGMHLQREPHAEVKLVRCTRGRVFDVALDLRPSSPTFKKWYGVELDGSTHDALYLPKGVAHGFQTLSDDVELFYQMGESYRPELSAGVRWNDPAFGIAWPIENPILSPRDASFPDFIERLA